MFARKGVIRTERFTGRNMKVTIRLLPTRKTTKALVLDNGSTAEDAIRKLGLYPDQWIPVRGETPIPLDARLKDGDEIKLISVVSGG